MSNQKKRQQLKKHKLIATGLLLLMAVLYGVMVYLEQGYYQPWMGYVKAFSEAGMVGALADWFAVTALFRHPLGLPIPHTNIIERKKDALGENLGHFVNENFLTPSTIRPYIENLDIVKIVVEWLENPKNKAGLEQEIGILLEKIIADLNDAEVEDFFTEKGTELLRRIDYSKLVQQGITYLIERDEHITLLENILPQIKNYIIENDQLILKRIADSRPFIALLAGKKITKEITEGLVAFISDIQKDRHHFVRRKLTENLEQFAEDLNTSSKWEVKFATLKEEIIVPKNLQKYAQDLWKTLKYLLQKQVNTPHGSLHQFIAKSISRITQNLKEDEVLQQRLNQWIHLFLYRMVLRNRKEIENLISATVSGWEAKELSEKLEMEVGKDLQFIRVNGTLVGGLVGVLIYLITHLFIS